MAVVLGGGVTGSQRTGHDAVYTRPKEMETNGTPVDVTGADTGLPRIILANGVTQRVKGVWEIPVRWGFIAVRFAAIPEIAGGGNTLWQFAYRFLTLGSGSVNGAMTTIAISPQAVGTTQFDWSYLQPSSVAAIPITLGGFGDSPFMHWSLSRLAGDTLDTVEGGVSIGLVTGTRVPNT